VRTLGAMQFENLRLQPGRSHVASRVCMQRDGTIIWPLAGRLVVWTMQSCNGRQAVMSAF
jgi:hypothetical protein